jgi:hypothetical protein
MLSSIRGHILKQPQYVLGLHGVFGSVSEYSGEDTFRSVWETFLEQIVNAIEQEWNFAPVRCNAGDLVTEAPNQSRNERYDRMKSIGEWKQNRLSLVDLGINDSTAVSQLGRHCDGVILVLASSKSSGTKQLDKLRKHNIPWLGYWNIEVQSPPPLQKVG